MSRKSRLSKKRQVERWRQECYRLMSAYQRRVSSDLLLVYKQEIHRGGYGNVPVRFDVGRNLRYIKGISIF